MTRLGTQLVIDEQSTIDSATTTGVLLEQFNEGGRAVKRAELDSFWVTILKNPALYDGGLLFNSNALTTAGGHANKQALPITTRDEFASCLIALSAGIGKQVIYAPDGTPNHLGLTATRIIVPAGNDIYARWFSQLMAVPNKDFRNFFPVIESRIGAIGCTDPAKEGVVVTGADNYMFLTAPAEQRQAIIKSYLSGSKAGPKIRQSNLSSGGYWGISYDIVLDIGIHVIDFRSWAMNVGA